MNPSSSSTSTPSASPPASVAEKPPRPPSSPKPPGLGFGVAKPWGDSERYDFLLDSGHGHFWRVQVKSTQRYAESRYRVKAAGWKATYTRDEIDFLVAWIIPENLWYVVPIHAFASRKNLRFYPHGGRKALYEKYREAWCLMACPRSAQIEPAQIEPAQIEPTQALASSRCQQPSVRCAVCPLCPLPTSFHLVIPNPLQR